ncbi:MAG: hypothetical protein QM723_37050 [Myxococcaceae bacterium]
MFVVSYQFFAHRDGEAPRSPWLAMVFIGGVFIVFFVFFAVRGRGTNRLSIEGSSLLSSGRSYQALEKFQLALKAAPRSTVIRHNIAIANLHLWRVNEAAESLRVSANHAGQLGLQDIRAISRPMLALAEALQGRRDLSEQTLKALDPATSANSPYALLAQCVTACRTGNWATAEAMVNRPEVYQFGGFFRAVSEVLGAWAAYQLRGENLRFNRVALYSEAGPDALRKVWPELADFAERSA